MALACRFFLFIVKHFIGPPPLGYSHNVGCS